MSYPIEITKTSYGFEYSIGALNIARGEWAKVSGEWQLRVWFMGDRDSRVGIASCDSSRMPLKAVLPFLQIKMSEKKGET